MSDFRKSGVNGEKTVINYCFTTPDNFEKKFEKTKVNYYAEEFEYDGDVREHGGKVFKPVDRGEYG